MPEVTMQAPNSQWKWSASSPAQRISSSPHSCLFWLRLWLFFMWNNFTDCKVSDPTVFGELTNLPLNWPQSHFDCCLMTSLIWLRKTTTNKKLIKNSIRLYCNEMLVFYCVIAALSRFFSPTKNKLIFSNKTYNNRITMLYSVSAMFVYITMH